jgi:DNA helicase-2/ATP-dependent DNA helicase PcrA
LRWYLGLYELFERERLMMGVLTFDDLIPEAWVLLARHEALARKYQEGYDAVMVDEFQDTNLSQVALLDILVARHKNYLVCGDDDQGIFGFRKASNTFILGFTKRYKATRYLISDNFRCYAEHTILANHVIHRNKHRAPKQLNPSRGFGGETVLATHATSEVMGAGIARNIREAIDAGREPKDIAVLVRLYAETGVIENSLITEGVPYRIIGNVPFYDRPENTLLLKYLRLAILDRRIEAGEMNASIKAEVSEVWWDVVRTPRRYVRREASDALLREVITRGTPPSAALLTAGGSSRYAGPKLVELGQTVAWLGEAVASPRASAHAVLMELERRLDYRQFLLDNSGFAETGQGRAQTVMTFIDYAKGKGNTEAFLSHLERISFSQAGLEKTPASSQVILSSVFRAKGLEWPHVIVPAINYGHYPAAGGNTDLSEERRLFYVALTRSKGRLDLHVVKDRPPSIFMEGLSELLDNANKSAVAFKKHVLEWEAQDALALVRVYQHLEGFISRWSGLTASERTLVAQWLLAANKAYSLASRAPLPRELERSLLEVTDLDEEKVALCASSLGVQHRLPNKQNPPALPSRRYDVQSDGMLERGARVRHALHGEGKIMGFGVERGLEFVEIAFDKGRNVKLPLKHAAFDIL